MFLKTFVFLIFILSMTCVSCRVDNEGVVTWADFMKKGKIGSQKLSNYLQPFINETVSHNNVSEQCAKSLFRYINGVKEWEPWAIQMFDATGKFPSGFLSGTKLDFGSYDQCLEIEVNQNEASTSFKGQYCMLDMKTPLIYPMDMITASNKSYIETYGVPPDWIYDMIVEQEGILLTFGLYLGACLPSTCSEQDIYNILTHVSKPAGVKIKISDCQVIEPKKWPVSAVISMYILASLLAICALGTRLDIIDRRKDEDKNEKSNESLIRKSLKAFSFYTNTIQVFEKQSSRNSMDFLHGIRFLLCIWIIACHLFAFPTRWKENKYSNYNRLVKLLIGRPLSSLVENGFLSVGIFFHLSGFLMSYILWRKLEESRGKLNIIQIAIYKYCRLTPAHLFFIMLTFVMPVIHNGPIWNSTWEEEQGKCQHFGWRNLLYIHNFLSVREMCWLHTWFLGALFQVQIVSLFLLFLTFRSPKKGIFVGLLLMIGCFINDYTISLKNNYPFQTVVTTRSYELNREIVKKIYFKPFHHLGANLIGMVLGWYILKFKDHKLQSKYHVIGWTLYIIGSLLTMFVIRFPIKDFRFIAFYNASRLTIWSFLFSWLVYCCTTGSGGIINRFLSWKAFYPISQISYGIYLAHPLLIVFKDATLRNRVEMTVLANITEMPVLILLSFILGFFIHIAVERPFNILFDLWLRSSSDASRKEVTVTNRMETVTHKNGKLLEKES